MESFDYQDAYAAPTGKLAQSTGDDTPEDRPDLRFLAVWERRRVLYNGVLVAEVFLTAGLDLWRPFLDPVFWEVLIAGAFGANVCYCTGPIVEAYLRWLGIRGRSLGPILFGLGLFLSVFLTFAVMAAYQFSQMKMD